MKIIAIGDSHCQLFDNKPEYKRGLWNNNYLTNIFSTDWLGPVTLRRLTRDKTSFLDLNKYNAYDAILLSFGEIDIRSNIMKQDNPLENIDFMLKELKDYLNNYKHLNIYFLSVLPPMKVELCTGVNPSFPFIGTNEERKELTVYLNNGIENICKELNLNYLDLFDLYNKEGFLDFIKSDTIIHAIKTTQLEEILIKKWDC